MSWYPICNAKMCHHLLVQIGNRVYQRSFSNRWCTEMGIFRGKMRFRLLKVDFEFFTSPPPPKSIESICNHFFKFKIPNEIFPKSVILLNRICFKNLLVWINFFLLLLYSIFLVLASFHNNPFEYIKHSITQALLVEWGSKVHTRWHSCVLR